MDLFTKIFDFIKDWKELLAITATCAFTIGSLLTVRVRSLSIRTQRVHSSPTTRGHGNINSSGNNSPIAYGPMASATSGHNSPIFHGNVGSFTIISASTSERVTRAVQNSIHPGKELKLSPLTQIVLFLLTAILISAPGAEIGIFAEKLLSIALTVVALAGLVENTISSSNEENTIDTISRRTASLVYFALTIFITWSLWRTLDLWQSPPAKLGKLMPLIEQVVAGFKAQNLEWTAHHVTELAYVIIPAMGLSAIMVWHTKIAFSYLSAGLGINHAIKFATFVLPFIFFALFFAWSGPQHLYEGQLWPMTRYVIYRIFLIDSAQILS